MKKILFAIATLAASTAAASPAMAQDWRGYGYNNGYSGYGYRDGAARICNGDRAHQLEAQIAHEEREGDIDRGTARYLHRMVDQAESQQGRACRYGDGYQIRELAQRFDWIGRQLNHEEREGRRWNGSYEY
jgi:opacity protein-like surface antigen